MPEEPHALKAEQRRIRVALGGHYGSPVRAGSAALLGAGALMIAAAAVWNSAILDVGVPILVVAAVVRLLAPPVATRARFAAEKAWVASLPFPMVGYFDVLGAEPKGSCHLRAALVWSDRERLPGVELVRAVVSARDTGGSVARRDEASVIIRSSSISCHSSVRMVNGPYLYRNEKVVAYVHGLVDGVLLPLHRSHAIDQVTLTRE